MTIQFTRMMKKSFLIMITLSSMTITACGGGLSGSSITDDNSTSDITDSDQDPTTANITGTAALSTIQTTDGENVNEIADEVEITVFAVNAKGEKITSQLHEDGSFSLNVPSGEEYMIGFSLDGQFLGTITYSVDENGSINVDRNIFYEDTHLGNVFFNEGYARCDKNPFRRKDHDRDGISDGDDTDFNFDESIYAYDENDLELVCEKYENNDDDDLDEIENEKDEMTEEDPEDDLDILDDIDDLRNQDDDQPNSFTNLSLEDGNENELEDEVENNDDKTEELYSCHYVENTIIEDSELSFDAHLDIEDGEQKPLWEDFCQGQSGERMRSCLRLVELCHVRCDEERPNQFQSPSINQDNFREMRDGRRSCMRECLF